ncbi:MAG TPA: SpvB/TcaC N-terminal domain-containing protein, partial [Spirochaetia bacterium]|nr:SpvB/TcaC N-terminal domain-containing protein [Spirochaetia bacterium]
MKRAEARTVRSSTTAFLTLLIFICTQAAAPTFADNSAKDRTAGLAPVKGDKPGPNGALPRESVGARCSKEALPDSVTVLTCNGVNLEVPAGAVKEAVEISIEPLSSVAALDPGMENVTSSVAGFRLLPRGMKFEQPVILRVPYQRGTLSGAELSNLYTWYYDETAKGWRRLERIDVDRQNCVVVSLTDHFTDFINSVLTLPQSPNPLQFNPTSIKDIKAADPAAGIPDPKWPEASAFGAAQFSISLDLPPGRQGMAPRLALSYNSDDSSGVVGRGFD